MTVSLDLLGFAASFIVLVSLLMSSLWRLRIINLIGAVVFTVYGTLIGAAPVAVVNFLIVVIDASYLWRMVRARRIVAREPRPSNDVLPGIPSRRGYSHDLLLR